MSERGALPNVVLAGAILVGGITAAETGVLGETPARLTDTVVKDVNDVFISRTEVNTNMELPKNIGAIAASTVEIVSYYKGPQDQDKDSQKLRGLTGSGTIIDYKGTKLIVTAAHVARETTEHCEDERIRFLRAGNRFGSTTINAASQTPSKGDKGIYKGSRDAIIIEPSLPYDGLKQNMVGMSVQPKVRLKKGDKIFSLGYGPRNTYDPSPLNPDIGKRRPVVVPGIVVDTDKKSVRFITGISAKRNAASDATHHGDSGGTVVDDSGKYVGDVVSIDKPMLGWKLENKFDIDLPKKVEGRDITTSTAEIVDVPTLDAMAGAMRPCSSALPSKLVLQ